MNAIVAATLSDGNGYVECSSVPSGRSRRGTTAAARGCSAAASTIVRMAPGSGHASEFSSNSHGAFERASSVLTPPANPRFSAPASTSASGTRCFKSSGVPSLEALSLTSSLNVQP